MHRHKIVKRRFILKVLLVKMVCRNENLTLKTSLERIDPLPLVPGCFRLCLSANGVGGEFLRIASEQYSKEAQLLCLCVCICLRVVRSSMQPGSWLLSALLENKETWLVPSGVLGYQAIFTNHASFEHLVPTQWYCWGRLLNLAG